MTLPEPRTARIAGRTVSWREKGAGTALVLVHGTGGSAALQHPIRRVAALDGIGHYLPIEDPTLFRRTLDRFLADKIDINAYF